MTGSLLILAVVGALIYWMIRQAQLIYKLQYYLSSDKSHYHYRGWIKGIVTLAILSSVVIISASPSVTTNPSTPPTQILGLPTQYPQYQVTPTFTPRATAVPMLRETIPPKVINASRVEPTPEIMPVVEQRPDAIIPTPTITPTVRLEQLPMDAPIQSSDETAPILIDTPIATSVPPQPTNAPTVIVQPQLQPTQASAPQSTSVPPAAVPVQPLPAPTVAPNPSSTPTEEKKEPKATPEINKPPERKENQEEKKKDEDDKPNRKNDNDERRDRKKKNDSGGVSVARN